MHEYAHLLTADASPAHGRAWQQAFSDLGYRREARAFVRAHGTG